jgi:hypothetical protein
MTAPAMAPSRAIQRAPAGAGHPPTCVRGRVALRIHERAHKARSLPTAPAKVGRPKQPAAQPGPIVLGTYTDARGRTRQVIAAQRRDGGALVVDRDATTLGERRLVAQLDADEPAVNAAIVCEHYLRDPSRGRCRRVCAEDLTATPGLDHDERELPVVTGSPMGELTNGAPAGEEGRIYRLGPVRTGGSHAQLRWQACSPTRPDQAPRPTSLREVVGALESYEPVCALTLAALAPRDRDPRVSVTTLRCELERLRESPVVLNRGLREAVLTAVERHGLSMSEIAARCDRIKRDGNGNASGETSWLARRIGMMPEGGSAHCTPWIHSDVLALIAREGLGISPREVEL